MGRSLKLYLLVMGITVIQITVNSLVPYFIYRSFGLNSASVITFIAAQVFVSMISAFVPLPGASGGAEVSFSLFFSMFFQATTLPALVLWRFLTYYTNILFGGIASYIGGRVFNKSTDEE